MQYEIKKNMLGTKYVTKSWAFDLYYLKLDIRGQDKKQNDSLLSIHVKVSRSYRYLGARIAANLLAYKNL